MLETGDLAPDFNAADHQGQEIRLQDFRGRQVVVLFFYPQDGTPVCTEEACSFRDSMEEFSQAGAVVIGVSGNSLESHRRFAESHQLPYSLLSDAKGTLRKLYQVPNSMGLVPKRVTFVIDRQGVIRHVFSMLFQGEVHAREALKIVQSLREEPQTAE